MLKLHREEIIQHSFRRVFTVFVIVVFSLLLFYFCDKMSINFYVLLLFLLFVVAAAAQLHPKQTQYDEQLSKRLMYLSFIAYTRNPIECLQESLPSARLWTFIMSKERICDSVRSNCSFYSIVSNSQRMIYIVFRGTTNLIQLGRQSWLLLQRDKESLQINFFDIGKVHEYYFNAHNVFWDDVSSILANEKYKDYEVIFTGHSLGGALASISALRTVLEKKRDSDQVKLYTFGQPRVGNIHMARKHDELVPNSFRVVQGFDVIPHCPACDTIRVEHIPDENKLVCDPDIINKYYHHGTEIWYANGMGNNANYYECTDPPLNEDFTCSNRMIFDISSLYKAPTYILYHLNYFEQKIPLFDYARCTTPQLLMETVSTIDTTDLAPPDASITMPIYSAATLLGTATTTPLDDATTRLLDSATTTLLGVIATMPLYNVTTTPLRITARTPLSATATRPLEAKTTTPIDAKTTRPIDVENVPQNSAVRSNAKIAQIVRVVFRFLSGGGLFKSTLKQHAVQKTFNNKFSIASLINTRNLMSWL